MPASSGLQTYRVLWPNNTTGVNIKAVPGQVLGWSIANAAAAVRYVKLYDKATAPTVGTDTPTHTIFLAAGGINNVFLGETGIGFANGIGIGATNLQADSDTTAPTAGDVVINVFYF